MSFLKFFKISLMGKNRRFKRVYLCGGTFSHKHRENATERTKIGKNGIFAAWLQSYIHTHARLYAYIAIYR